MNITTEDLRNMPKIPDEEKILFWMREAKEAKHAKWQLEIVAQAALDAYESRFESTTGKGNYLGPIDEEMKALREELTPKIVITTDNGYTATVTQAIIDSLKEIHGVDAVKEIQAALNKE